MGKRAFVLGGTGFVGRHAARWLADSGWDVSIGARGETAIPPEVRGIPHVSLDRGDDVQLKKALGVGLDEFVDVIPYERRDAEQIVSLKTLVGSAVAISTGSVYADDEGRTMDEATSEGPFPISRSRSERRSGTAPRGRFSNGRGSCALFGPGDPDSLDPLAESGVLEMTPGDEVVWTTAVPEDAPEIEHLTPYVNR